MIVQAGPDLKYRFYWLLVGYALVALVVVLSLMSDPANVRLNIPFEDKVYHMLAYFTLMAWFSQIYHDRLRRNLFAVLFIIMGVLLEYLQSFEPSRFAEFGDMLANTAGVALGYLVNLSAVKYSLLKIEGMLG